MHRINAVRQFLRRSDGFVLSTETIIWVTLTVCALVIGISALRIALTNLYLDVAESLASRESGFVFTEMAPAGSGVEFLTVRVSNSSPAGTFPSIGPLLPSRPLPTSAQDDKESGATNMDTDTSL